MKKIINEINVAVFPILFDLKRDNNKHKSHLFIFSMV